MPITTQKSGLQQIALDVQAVLYKLNFVVAKGGDSIAPPLQHEDPQMSTSPAMNALWTQLKTIRKSNKGGPNQLIFCASDRQISGHKVFGLSPNQWSGRTCTAADGFGLMAFQVDELANGRFLIVSAWSNHVLTELEGGFAQAATEIARLMASNFTTAVLASDTSLFGHDLDSSLVTAAAKVFKIRWNVNALLARWRSEDEAALERAAA